jgi:hypothetical protein
LQIEIIKMTDTDVNISSLANQVLLDLLKTDNARLLKALKYYRKQTRPIHQIDELIAEQDRKQKLIYKRRWTK